jgi:hypothetical protein
MDDPDHELVLAMFGLAIAAVMLVAGELYAVTRPDPLEAVNPPPLKIEQTATPEYSGIP